MTMTLQDAIAEVVELAPWEISSFEDFETSIHPSWAPAVVAILQAVASGDLIPRADALAEVQALRAERDAWMQAATNHANWQQAAEAEVAKLRDAAALVVRWFDDYRPDLIGERITKLREVVWPTDDAALGGAG